MLQTVELHRDDRARIRRELRVMTLSLAGFSDEELKDLDETTTEKLQELVKQKLNLRAGNGTNGNGRRHSSTNEGMSQV
jgi:hypothetical protein